MSRLLKLLINKFLRTCLALVFRLNCCFPFFSTTRTWSFPTFLNSKTNLGILDLNTQTMLGWDSMSCFRFPSFPQPISCDLWDTVPYYSRCMIIFLMSTSSSFASANLWLYLHQNICLALAFPHDRKQSLFPQWYRWRLLQLNFCQECVWEQCPNFKLLGLNSIISWQVHCCIQVALSTIREHFVQICSRQSAIVKWGFCFSFPMIYVLIFWLTLGI